MDATLEALLDTSPVVARRAELAGIVDYALRLGEIEAVLPGVYARKGHTSFVDVRIEALRLYEPKAVLLAATAARASFMPALPVENVTAAVNRKLRQQAGFRLIRRTVPDDWVTGDDARLVKPALAALEAGPDVVDYALRQGVITLPELEAAYEATKRWLGHDDRRRLVEESSDNPWSAAEREFHRLLRAAGITDWRGNYPVGDHLVDVAFLAQRLAIEIDGKHYHGDANFEKDRWQQNALVLAGWRVLRFTWAMIEKHPDRVVKTVRTALSR